MGLHLRPSLGIRETNPLFSLRYSSPNLQLGPELKEATEPPHPNPRTNSADKQSAKMGELEAAGHHGLVQGPAVRSQAWGAQEGEAIGVSQETLAGVGC